MNEYTTICSEEQTKRALELGAPITIKHVMGEDGIVKQYIPISPTVEQMIGWLEEQDGIEEITVCKTGMWVWGKNHTLIKGSPNYSSRQESSLAAIDVALDYLTNKIIN